MSIVLGQDTPIDELVDFIVAAQIAEKFEEDTNDTVQNGDEKNEVFNILALSSNVFYMFFNAGEFVLCLPATINALLTLWLSCMLIWVVVFTIMLPFYI